MKLLICFLLIYILGSCSKKDDSESEGKKTTFGIGGKVSLINNFIFTPAHASGDSELCSSECSVRVETCASLFLISGNGNEKWICDTKVDESGNYKFNIGDGDTFKSKKIKVKINSFKGQDREIVTNIGSTDENVVDINFESTIESLLKDEDIRNGRQINSEYRQLLKENLKQMCSTVVNDSNVELVMKNSLGYFMSSFSKALIKTWHNNFVCNNDNSSLSSDLNLFCSEISSIVSVVGQGKTKARLVDRLGVPYPNLYFFLAQNDGSLSSSSANGSFFTSDSNGYIDITSLPNGGYTFILANETSAPDVFLWASNWKYSGHFEKNSDVKVYNLVLPRVIQFEKSVLSTAPNLLSTFQKYYAQSFTIASKIDFCGVGFGMGLGGNGSPDVIQIRNDLAGVPSSNILYESKVLKFTGAVSYGREAGFANVCDTLSKMGNLDSGKYWVVAKYNILPSQISVLGDESAPQNGSAFLSSSDGDIWTPYDISVWYNGGKIFRKLEFFLSH